MRPSEKDIYATANVSILHVLDHDFLYGVTGNKDVDYVYSGADKSVVVNLAAISNQWDVVAETLTNDGFNSDCTPHMLAIFEKLFKDDIRHIEFNERHPKLKGIEWFTPESFMELKPIAYDLNLLSYNELTEEQKAQKHISLGPADSEAFNKKVYAVIENGPIVNVSYAEDLILAEPEEIIHDYDKVLSTPTGEELVLKINEENATVSIAMIMN